MIAFARRYPSWKLIAIRGANSDLAPRIARVERERDEKRGVVRKGSNRFFNIGVNQFKMSLYRDLTKEDPSQPGISRFRADAKTGYFRRSWARPASCTNAGARFFYRWEKIAAHQATEMLGALVYASAAGLKHGVNAISDQGWHRLEAEFELLTCRGTNKRVGATAGLGVEYGLTPNISAKIEYRYIAAASLELSHINEFLAGVNYRFGGP